ncbi:MAG TPA: DUF2071 domain-containing protein [Terracidiphilus sp.]|nr:DUF2071 domain-containing protein [Terracidiphilus sp.]
MQQYMFRTSNTPRPLPKGRWAMAQRWNDLLFAHWPLAAAQISPLLPEWLDVDTFQGSAWLGAVPFWLDRVKFRRMPPIPGARSFPDLNLRTYVRDRLTGSPGIYCFSLDASSLIAVGLARTVCHLPYHWAEMWLEQRSDREFAFYSRRRLANRPVIFKARYRGLGPRESQMRPGSFEHFITERSCLFSANRAGQPIRASLHYIPWPLEDAEAEIERNDLAASIGLELPGTEPVLHYSRRLAVYIWPPEPVRPALAAHPVHAAASPVG